MKRLLIITIIFVSACSEDDSPVFKIDSSKGNFDLEERFNIFEDKASEYGVTVPRNNMILRFVEDPDNLINDSDTYVEGGQRYVDIDIDFCRRANQEPQIQTIVFQQLAHGLLDRDWETCGIMLKVNNDDDLRNRTFNMNFENLFDPSVPCD